MRAKKKELTKAEKAAIKKKAESNLRDNKKGFTLGARGPSGGFARITKEAPKTSGPYSAAAKKKKKKETKDSSSGKSAKSKVKSPVQKGVDAINRRRYGVVPSAAKPYRGGGDKR